MTITGQHGDVAAAYDAIADRYDEAYSDALSLAENAALAALLNEAGVFDHDGVTVDAGCGTGLLLDICPQSPDAYLGIDISMRMLSRAQDKYPRHAFMRRDLDQSWQLGAFAGRVRSLVCLFSAFSYFPLEDAVAEMTRVLPHGAPFFVMLYGYDSPPKVFSNGVPDAVHRKDSPAVAAQFWEQDWSDVKVRGFSAVRVPSSRWLLGECRSLGRVAPSLGRYLIVTGRRR